MNKEQAQECYERYQERGTVCAGCKYQFVCGLFDNKGYTPQRQTYVNVLTGEVIGEFTENELEAHFELGGC